MGLLACWLKLHKTRVVAVYHYNQISSVDSLFASTIATQVCECCGQITTTDLARAGHLTVEELNPRPRPYGPVRLRVVKNGKPP